ncbi:MAG: NADH-quinone oxidoreductase subunit L [Anaerolineales bacterium]
MSGIAGGAQGFGLAPWVLAFPLIGLAFNLLFGRRRREAVVGGVASAALAASFLASLGLAVALRVQPEGALVPLTEWIHIGPLQLDWSMRLDTLSVTLMLMVTGVSTLIHVYAIGYMHEDVRHQGDPSRFRRFFVYFNLFVAFMLILISADNFVMMFVGWEGVGLCSYLLIGFWFEKGEGGLGNARAGKKAFIVNRVGDVGFLIAMFLTFTAFGSLRFEEVFQRAQQAGPSATGVVTAIALFLLVGATGKSAQIPLFVWLPDAMAGPTPVSALIHAATMVTAGIYLVARTHVLFALAPVAALAVALVGATTALFSASVALGQFDIKKVLAYSTISQLGFMMAAVGMGAYVAGLFHLLTHAFFKALLFLGAGSVIQGVERGHAAGHGGHDGELDPQDMRAMGGLRARLGWTFPVFLVGALALAGLPPLAGFFSKDEILTAAWDTNPVVYGLLTAASFLTAVYVGRQLMLVFFGRPRSEAAGHARENPPVMIVPLVALAALSFLGGALNLPGVHTLEHWLEPSLRAEPVEFSPLVAGISASLAVLGLGLAVLLYRQPVRPGAEDPLARLLGPVFRGIRAKWWVDEGYTALVVRPYEKLAEFLAWTVDERLWHDRFHEDVLAAGFRRSTAWLADSFDLKGIDATSNRLAAMVQRAASGFRVLQSGFVRTYALSVLVGSILILSYLVLH